MARDGDTPKVVSVTTEEVSGGITATVVTSDGDVHTGRSHWFNTFMGQGEATESEAIRNAMDKIK
jgi:hypothetical protein